MKYVDEFRDPKAAKELIKVIKEDAAKLPKPINVMEVCGGHTHTIYRYGLENLLPDNINLIHGPGCPVCVIPMGRVDDAMWLAHQEGVILTTFGDMMRVPGSDGTSLLQARAAGCDVRFVYSPLDALQVARENPDKHVVFFAVGFETTAPSTCVTLIKAKEEDIDNFSIFSNHVTIQPPLQKILDGGETAVDGFIGPGHVATIVGTDAFEFLPQDYDRPVVVTGFEPLDVLEAIHMLIKQFLRGEAKVENEYSRVVKPEGNLAALKMMDNTFTVRDKFEWRGLGELDDSGLAISEEYAKWDAEKRFDLPGNRVADPKACECGAVLSGHIKPWQCKVFGTACTPDTPIGTCMVSPEGACAAYYNFGRIDRELTLKIAAKGGK
ncbi:MAG: hydrogenase formation protein HypD [Corynebacterium pyruviciproducens]|uniref:Hydrogenase expression/formation protein HypD n=2 Tax=Corynebacterium pyruviciproducens TaxID=598660 RepID=S2Z4H8_9CORY|nr:hydrogenase formation protein HypD [Corynebacterium pyruviciproducens]EPD69125.1 hydrogenase expression/formation protein HypD [Corynebacterium pyruviciproducens ATCC BAA-1742]MDH4659238.1 hydrogenase formation protein HypD [Corynebacterium pyruviciproducens]MDK6564824.1 hydrogenase formation protein HypD [Corynebacterium pyruviciproducens]WOT02511.1 hydrogenase formation protein HypD [Corynebacterium pyruviciproducens]